MTVQTNLRNANLDDLRQLLVEQHARKIDVVAPASKIRADEGDIVIAGLDPLLEADGVTDPNGRYRPTAVFDEGMSDKLKIPLAYVRRLRDERSDLYDVNVNGWLHGAREKARIDQWGARVVLRQSTPPDDRSFMLRTFRGDDGGPGIARALLSNSYLVADNLDALVAALAGVAQAGVNVRISGCDLTDRRMYVRIEAPEVQALAPTLLRGYRSPFTGQTGDDNPVVFAGFEISNSETGGGAFSMTPRLVVQVCSNGMKITKDAVRAVHLGGKMEESVIRWTEDTQRKEIELISAKARDAVTTFLDVEYMKRVILDAEKRAGQPFSKPEENLKVIGKQLKFSDATIESVFSMFVQGGQMTAGGVMQAVTAASQVITDADVAAEVEGQAFRAMELAAAM